MAGLEDRLDGRVDGLMVRLMIPSHIKKLMGIRQDTYFFDSEDLRFKEKFGLRDCKIVIKEEIMAMQLVNLNGFLIPDGIVCMLPALKAGSEDYTSVHLETEDKDSVYRYMEVRFIDSVVVAFADTYFDGVRGWSSREEHEQQVAMRMVRHTVVNKLCEHGYIIAGRGYGYERYVMVVPNLPVFREAVEEAGLCLTHSDEVYRCDVMGLPTPFVEPFDEAVLALPMTCWPCWH